MDFELEGEECNKNLRKLLEKFSSNRKDEENLKKDYERFNVFDILEYRSNEEWIHSKFLAELLNPNGSHKRENFLKLFLKIIDLENFYSDGDDVKIEREKNIGKINEDFTKGGRIDIAIINRTKNKRIYLENKTAMHEQPNQLLRYSNDEPDYLLYLTPNGIEAKSAGNSDIKPLSYADHILKWLEQCKESIDNSILCSTLTQYIWFVEKLLELTRSEKMKEEDFKVITENAENMRAACKISSDLSKVKLRLFTERLQLPLLQIFAKNNLAHDSKIWVDSVREGWYCVAFRKKGWNSSHFRFCVKHNWNLDELQYGLVVDDSTSEISHGIRDKMEKADFKRFADATYSHIIYLTKDIKDWNENSFAELCKSDNNILKSFEDKIDELLGFIT